VTPYYDDGKGIVIYNGDNTSVLPTLAENSVDAIVTDPPYGISFMGKRWDYDIPTVEQFAECLRVLKPGGHLLCFCGTRTQHRMAVNIEDAGFEMRDVIAWLYGSGFPKSLDVGKSIDKAAGAEREVVGSRKMRELPSDVPFGQGLITSHANAIAGRNTAAQVDVDITAPATEAAKQWDGWGTALKPSMELVTVARKPFPGTVAANVLKYGTGALNVDACRIESTDSQLQEKYDSVQKAGARNNGIYGKDARDRAGAQPHTLGRFPANTIHDGSEEVLALFPETTGDNRNNQGGSRPSGFCNIGAENGDGKPVGDLYADSGSAARYFYCAKADKTDRDGTKHPTVKPIDLMRYLVRLVCPIGGIVLDPWCGSGTTVYAARAEHCKAIGIERELEYVTDAANRLAQGVLDFGE
jgi:DNA modification methylase